jgi:hypothetical protein
MFGLIYLFCKISIRLFIWSVLLSAWLMLAMIALPTALIASATGHDYAARQWQRSLRWRWRF